MKNLILMLAILFIGVVSAQTTYYPQTGTDSETYTWDGTDTFTDGTDSWTAVGEYISQLDTYFQTAPPAEITPDGSQFYRVLRSSRITDDIDYIEIGSDYIKLYDCDGEVGMQSFPNGINTDQTNHITATEVPFITGNATLHVTSFGIQFQENGILNTPYTLSNGGNSAAGWERIEFIPSCAALAEPTSSSTASSTSTGPAIPRSGDTYATYYDDIDFSDERNLQQFVGAFLRDAELAGVVVDGTTGTVEFGTLGSSSSGTVLGQAENVCAPGYQIKVDETEWLSLRLTAASAPAVDYYEEGRKIRLIYHELGHALLQLDHSCYDRVVVRRLMAGPVIHGGSANPDYISATSCDGGSRSHSDAVLAAVGGSPNGQWQIPAIELRVADLFSMVPDYQFNCGSGKGNSGSLGKSTIYN